MLMALPNPSLSLHASCCASICTAGWVARNKKSAGTYEHARYSPMQGNTQQVKAMNRHMVLLRAVPMGAQAAELMEQALYTWGRMHWAMIWF